jgi:L-ascorbate metabolism protein UlaG (beta-lactamase superfamily)
MMPEQTVQAAVDLQAKSMLAVHWGKFSLAMHPWNEPINRVAAAAEILNMKLHTPSIGEPLLIEQEVENKTWWNMK